MRRSCHCGESCIDHQERSFFGLRIGITIHQVCESVHKYKQEASKQALRNDKPRTFSVRKSSHKPGRRVQENVSITQNRTFASRTHKEAKPNINNNKLSSTCSKRTIQYQRVLSTSYPQGQRNGDVIPCRTTGRSRARSMVCLQRLHRGRVRC